MLFLTLSPSTTIPDARDVLEPGRLGEKVKATPAQKDLLATWVDSIRSVAGDHQWEVAKHTNEGRLWQGFVPRLEDIQKLRELAGLRVGTYLDSIRAVLAPDQVKRLDRILEKADLLAYPVRDTPFHHISTSPLKPQFKDKTKAYQLTGGEETVANAWSYADLLETWTVTSYVKRPRPIEEQGLVQAPDVQVSANSPTLRSMIVSSPLVLAATLVTPDLGRAEFEVLYNHYPHTFTTKEAARDSYTASIGAGDNILIRLKMSTPSDAYYLSMDRYIIYLEDDKGTGYEPLSVSAEPIRKLEAVEVRVPGQTVTYTDVFGTYTGRPGHKVTRTVSNPSRIQYAGQERLIKLYFPSRDFSGNPILGPETLELKLIVQPELEDLTRMELTWDLKRKPRERK